MALADGMIQFVGIWPNGKRSDCEHIHQPMDAMLLPIAEKSDLIPFIQLNIEPLEHHLPIDRLGQVLDI